MSIPFVNPAPESPALRRISLLLERLRDDAPLDDDRLLELDEGISAMRRAATAGTLVHASALDALEAAVLGCKSRRQTPMQRLLHHNVTSEARDLVERLRTKRPRAEWNGAATLD